MTIQPEAVTKVDLAFPARGMDLKPGLEECPPDFEEDRIYAGLFIDTFMGKTGNLELIPAEDIDPQVAYDHLRVVIGCYAFKHQDKERLWCWLASQWFPAFRYQRDDTLVEHNWPQ